MYRNIFVNKETGDKECLWRYYNSDLKIYQYFKDISLKNEVDILQYELISEEEIKTIPTPYQLFGVECEKGWYSLLQPVVDYIDNYNKDKPKDEWIYIIQIKEKYGTLRFYTNFVTPELDELISKAENESELTCEMCGTKKHIGSTLGWLITICHDCVKEYAQKQGYTCKWHNYDDDKIYNISPNGEDEFFCTFKDYQKDLP